MEDGRDYNVAREQQSKEVEGSGGRVSKRSMLI